MDPDSLLMPLDIQYELFSSPVLRADGFTQGLHLYDILPMFEYDRARVVVSKASKRDDLTRTRTLESTSNGKIRSFTIEGVAAAADNGFRFPGVREEVIMDALKHIAFCGGGDMVQRETPNGAVDECTVVFTLNQVRSVLKEMRGKDMYNISEIKSALNVLHEAPFRIKVVDENQADEYSEPLISSLTLSSTRKTGENALCSARLHPLVSASIRSMNFRQYNLAANIKLRSPTARRFHKYLSMVFKRANVLTPYEANASDTMARLGLQLRIIPGRSFENAIRPLKGAIKELIEHGLLESGSDEWADEIYGINPHSPTNRTVKIDAKLRLVPSHAFIQDMRKSNAIRNDAEARNLLAKALRETGANDVALLSALNRPIKLVHSELKNMGLTEDQSNDVPAK